MSWDNPRGGLTDRERILTYVITGLQSSMLMRPRASQHDAASWDDGMGGVHVHFARYRKPEKGDLVLGWTGRVDEWKIAFYEENSGNGNHVVRDINTGRLCNYGNEEFIPIVGLTPTQLLTGDRRQFYYKVLEAFARGDEYLWLFGGLEFDGDEAVIRVRERWGGMGGPSVPFSVRIRWTKRTSIKAILAALKEGGYGWRSFYPWGDVVDDFGQLVTPTPHPHMTWREHAQH